MICSCFCNNKRPNSKRQEQLIQLVVIIYRLCVQVTPSHQTPSHQTPSLHARPPRLDTWANTKCTGKYAFVEEFVMDKNHLEDSIHLKHDNEIECNNSIYLEDKRDDLLLNLFKLNPM